MWLAPAHLEHMLAYLCARLALWRLFAYLCVQWLTHLCLHALIGSYIVLALRALAHLACAGVFGVHSIVVA